MNIIHLDLLLADGSIRRVQIKRSHLANAMHTITSGLMRHPSVDVPIGDELLKVVGVLVVPAFMQDRIIIMRKGGTDA